jgi:NCAIR mutase (PurE)-related protein
VSKRKDKEPAAEPQPAGEIWINNLLQRVKSGELPVSEAVRELSVLPYEDLMHSKLDHHRSLRTGFPEVIYGPGKTIPQLVTIVERMSVRSARILVTRVDERAYRAVKARVKDAQYNPAARAIVVNRSREKGRQGISVVTGGTADIPVAEEAAVTAEIMGNRVSRIFDVGVAGIHRLLDHLPVIRQSNVVVAVAGMDGVLPAVLGGLVTCPVIAVPTSVGYGASFQGVAPLLTMLNSCAPGVAVVNIDGGFNAGFLAGLINRR